MNPTKLAAAALCAAACVTTTAFAEDDFGIESASPVKIADPVNPQPGMVLNAYRLERWMNWDALAESISKLPSQAAAKTMVDKSEHFSLEPIGKIQAGVGRWEGFLKCKRATTYTFVLSKEGYDGSACGFVFAVNGKVYIKKGIRQASCDVDLKVGWNKIDIVCQYDNPKPLTMTFKPKTSTAEPRPIAPKDLFHDQKPEEDW